MSHILKLLFFSLVERNLVCVVSKYVYKDKANFDIQHLLSRKHDFMAIIAIAGYYYHCYYCQKLFMGTIDDVVGAAVENINRSKYNLAI